MQLKIKYKMTKKVDEELFKLFSEMGTEQPQGDITTAIIQKIKEKEQKKLSFYPFLVFAVITLLVSSLFIYFSNDLGPVNNDYVNSIVDFISSIHIDESIYASIFVINVYLILIQVVALLRSRKEVGVV